MADLRCRRDVLAFDDVATARLRLVISQARAINEIRVYREPERAVERARRVLKTMRVPDEPVERLPLRPSTPRSAPRRRPGPASGYKGLDPARLPGIVIDAAAAKRLGTWSPSTHTPPYIGDGYFTDDNNAKGSKSIRFEPKLSKPGKYELRLAYSALSNRASNTPVTVNASGGAKTIRIDQRRKPPVDGLFFPLGTFLLDENSTIVVGNAGTDGYVVVDALQLQRE